MEELMISLFLAGIAGLLWGVPKTRRMTGSLVTAGKTVPLGCLTAFWLPELLLILSATANYHWRFFPNRILDHGLLVLAFALIGLFAGTALIVTLSRWSWHRFHADGKRSWLPHLFLFVFLAVGLQIATIAFSFFRYALDPAGYRGAWRSCNLPTEQGTDWAFESRSIHPYLAEYDYRLRFEKSGKTWYRPLLTNTGGQTRIHLYRLTDGRFQLSGNGENYLVDVSLPEVWYLFEDRQNPEQLFAVPFPEVPFKDWGWGRDENGMMFYFDQEKRAATPVNGELAGKIDYGTITTEFQLAEPSLQGGKNE